MVGSVEAAIFIVAGTKDTRPPPAAAELAVAPTTEAAILPSLLNLLKWVLLPDNKSISSIASIEAMGAFPLKKKISEILSQKVTQLLSL